MLKLTQPTILAGQKMNSSLAVFTWAMMCRQDAVYYQFVPAVDYDFLLNFHPW